MDVKSRDMDPDTPAHQTTGADETPVDVAPALVAEREAPIRLSKDLWLAVSNEARESHTSPSELVRDGVALILQRRAGLRAVAEWEAEHGELTDEELEQAYHTLFGTAGQQATA